MSVEKWIRAHVADIEPYQPPDLERIAAHAGLDVEDLIRLDANENAFGPSPRVAEALALYTQYAYYPDYRALTEAVAKYAGVAPDQVVLGNGADEIIDLILRLTLEPGQGLLICPPTFDMYRFFAEVGRRRVWTVPLRENFAVDVPAVEALVRETGQNRPRLLFLTSPGNPDGQPIPLAVVERLLRLPLLVVVDEAYIEFGGETVLPLLSRYENLAIIRTFSKWAALAGLRLGYALLRPELAGQMNRIRPPCNVNAAAVVAAMATFSDLDALRATMAQLIAERERLQQALAEIPGLEPIPSQANFILCRVHGSTGTEVAEALVERGILVRSFHDARMRDYVRFGIGRPEQNQALLEALRDLTGLSDLSGLRSAQVQRKTQETQVEVIIDLDGQGHCQVETGIGFLDHMLSQVAVHGLFDLEVRARGDLEVDEHHTVEDVAIVLGQALDQALGERRGLVRVAHAYFPMDEALARVVLDLSGRPYAVIEVGFSAPMLGTMNSDLIVHFMETLAVHSRMALHAQVLYGRNDHHKAEALFKALARALDTATRLDPRRQEVPSTKGVLR
jgi:histidinol-phosphate aminotransferase